MSSGEGDWNAGTRALKSRARSFSQRRGICFLFLPWEDNTRMDGGSKFLKRQEVKKKKKRDDEGVPWGWEAEIKRH